MLSIDQLNEFRETGLLVIEDVLTGEEIEAARNAFHNHLKEKLGIDHSAVLDGTASPPLHRIKSPVSRIFYPGWKLLDVHMHPNVSGLAKELLCKTYWSAEDPLFAHPFAPFQDIHAYVDRICWRLPDSIRAEGGLGLHLDRNPFDPYLLQITGLSKWRPIQAIVCLTDHYDGDSGGLKVVPGFHKDITNYFTKDSSTAAGKGEGGEFYRLSSVSHTALQRKCRSVMATAGSMVFWDNRLPHATADRLAGFDSREVIYTGFLPRVKLNLDYVSKQLDAIKNNRPPPAYDDGDSLETSDRDFSIQSLTGEQRALLGFTE